MTNTTNKNPVFIVGAPRSGTTLMAQILSRHEDVFIYNETVFYDFLVSSNIDEDTEESSGLIIDYLINRLDFTQSKETEKEFGCVITKDDVNYIVSKIEENRKYLVKCSKSEIFSSIMSIIAKRKGKQIWGEKTPNHIFHLHSIINDFPDARIIHVLRSPEAFILSYKFMWRQSGSKNPEAAKKLYNPYATSKLWIKSTEAFLKFVSRNKDSVIEVRYEDLVNDSANVLTRVCEFLEIHYSDVMLDVRGSNTSFPDSKEKLSNWELVVCDTLTKKYKKLYGYDAYPCSNYSRIVALVKAYATLPKFLFSALPIVLRYFNGGLIKYLKSRGVFGSRK